METSFLRTSNLRALEWPKLTQWVSVSSTICMQMSTVNQSVDDQEIRMVTYTVQDDKVQRVAK